MFWCIKEENTEFSKDGTRKVILWRLMNQLCRVVFPSRLGLSAVNDSFPDRHNGSSKRYDCNHGLY